MSRHFQHCIIVKLALYDTLIMLQNDDPKQAASIPAARPQRRAAVSKKTYVEDLCSETESSEEEEAEDSEFEASV